MTAAMNYVPLDSMPEWPDPEPLWAPGEERFEYPVDALPPAIRNAVEEYRAFGQQPAALVASSALAAAALATQALADVARDPQLIGPISLNLLLVAVSGERKTSADRRMARAAREWQRDRRAAMEPELIAAKSRHDAWEAERTGLLGQLKSAAGKPSVEGQADVEGLRAKLAELDGNEPKVPAVPALFYEDASQGALGQWLASGWPSASLWSDEGGLTVGSRAMADESAMRFLSLMNRLWDAVPFERQRTTAKSFTVAGRRVSACLMVQPVVMERLLALGGGAARGLGSIARMLIARPKSTMGTRLYREAAGDGAAMAAFDARIRVLLEMKLPTVGPNMELEPPVLHLSAAARAAWIGYHDQIERQLGRASEFGSVADVAAKSAENAARIGAVFHVFEHGPHGEIAEDTMRAAIRVAVWYLGEARRLFEALKVPEAVQDAREVLEWANGTHLARFSERDLQRLGPSRLRGDRARRKAAIKLLAETGHLKEHREGRAGVLLVNPGSCSEAAE